MATQITNYQCPACTGPLQFSADSGKLECEYCGSCYTTGEIEQLYAAKEETAAENFAQEEAKEEIGWDSSEMTEDWGEDGEKMRAYTCPSCGAELICDETTAATSCPYCGNPTVVPGQFVGVLKPDYVIPFKVDREAAIGALKRHYKGKLLLPKAFSNSNHLEEIKGVYVPFWLFDGTAEADVRYQAIRTRIYRRGNEEITEKDHYFVRRAGSMVFMQVPVDASTKMPDNHMDSIEPYDYTELKPFSTAYLPGYLADKYDVEMEQCAVRVDERCRQSAVDALRGTVLGYDFVAPISQNVRMQRGKVSYVLLPVWMLKTKWNGKDFLFAMNGQTGKMVGDLPISWGKLAAWFAGVFGVMTAVMALLFG